LFCAALALVTALGQLPWAIAALYIILSSITLIAYGLDKTAAKKQQWRIQETTLHLFAVLGGWPGALLAQKILRHKSKKRLFQRLFWITVLINCLLLTWLLTASGSVVLMTLLGTDR
jgi:uncharacterized membrane protein YsdA (DUF1294 family)